MVVLLTWVLVSALIVPRKAIKYKNPDGKEVLITCVSTKRDISDSYKWDDTISVGPVESYVGRATVGEIDLENARLAFKNYTCKDAATCLMLDTYSYVGAFHDEIIIEVGTRGLNDCPLMKPVSPYVHSIVSEMGEVVAEFKYQHRKNKYSPEMKKALSKVGIDLL